MWFLVWGELGVLKVRGKGGPKHRVCRSGEERDCWNNEEGWRGSMWEWGTEIMCLGAVFFITCAPPPSSPSIFPPPPSYSLFPMLYVNCTVKSHYIPLLRCTHARNIFALFEAATFFLFLLFNRFFVLFYLFLRNARALVVLWIYFLLKNGHTQERC